MRISELSELEKQDIIQDALGWASSGYGQRAKSAYVYWINVTAKADKRKGPPAAGYWEEETIIYEQFLTLDDGCIAVGYGPQSNTLGIREIPNGRG